LPELLLLTEGLLAELGLAAGLLTAGFPAGLFAWADNSPN